MTKQEAKKTLNDMKERCNDTFHRVRYVSEEEALGMAISAIKLIGHLNNRPCEACEFHKENGCCKWNCVFDDLLYAEHKG